MKKYLWLLIIFLIPTNIKAANANINVTVNKNSVVVGSSVTATVTVSSASIIGAWQFDVKYDSSRLTPTSTTPFSIAETTKNPSGQKKVTFVYTFKAIKSGNATISISNSRILGFDEQYMTVTNGSKTVKVITQAELEASYSKDNYLSTLSIDGYEISPAFSKDITEYTVELPNEVETIKVNAKVNDYRSSITGIGDISVSEGENKIEIKVTAENGNLRIYNIKATVKELSPINIEIDGKKYSVVRKKEFLPEKTLYINSATTISGEEVPTLYNEKNDYTLVGLKDIEGNVELYLYDSIKDTYSKYEEAKFNTIILRILPFEKEVPNHFDKKAIEINGILVEGYKMNDSTRFALIYGLNIETSNKGIYVFDNLENTLQRYNEEEVNYLTNIIKKERIEKYSIIGISMALAIALAVILLKKDNNKKNKSEEELLLIDKKVMFKNNEDDINIMVVVTNNRIVLIKKSLNNYHFNKNTDVEDIINNTENIQVNIKDLIHINKEERYYRFCMKDGSDFRLYSKKIIPYFNEIIQ